MSNPGDIDFNQEGSRRATAYPRAVGSPLPRGGGLRANPAGMEPESRPLPPPGRSLGSGAPSAKESGGGSGMHRAMKAIRSAVPFIQRLLPLLDGNIVTAVSGALTPPQKPAPPVNLAPIEESLNEMQVQQRELQDQVAEQNLSIQKVEDQLQMVREATDRNTLEQQELMEDLKSVGKKANVVAFVALGLLAISVLLNLVLYLHIKRVLP